MGCGLLEEALENVDAELPGVFGGRGNPGRRELAAECRVGEQTRDCGADIVDATAWHQAIDAIDAEIAIAVRVGTDDRRSTGHRFERGETETLVCGRLNEHRRRTHQLVHARI
jgi:hypothetical protein